MLRESVAITQNKQKDLTNSSSTLLLDEEAPSSLFFYFSPSVIPIISKISLYGRTFWHSTTAPTKRRLTSDKLSTKRQTTQQAMSCNVTY